MCVRNGCFERCGAFPHSTAFYAHNSFTFGNLSVKGIDVALSARLKPIDSADMSCCACALLQSRICWTAGLEPWRHSVKLQCYNIDSLSRRRSATEKELISRNVQIYFGRISKPTPTPPTCQEPPFGRSSPSSTGVCGKQRMHFTP
jgi:hypothetical protein